MSLINIGAWDNWSRKQIGNTYRGLSSLGAKVECSLEMRDVGIRGADKDIVNSMGKIQLLVRFEKYFS